MAYLIVRPCPIQKKGESGVKGTFIGLDVG
jgi:hypothetical protein